MRITKLVCIKIKSVEEKKQNNFYDKVWLTVRKGSKKMPVLLKRYKRKENTVRQKLNNTFEKEQNNCFWILPVPELKSIQ